MTEIEDVTSKFFPDENETDVEESWLQKAAKAKRTEEQQKVQEALTKDKSLKEGASLDSATDSCIARLRANRQKLEQEVMANIEDSDVVEDLDVDKLEASIGDVDDWSDSLLSDYRPEEAQLRENVDQKTLAVKLNDVLFNAVSQCYNAEDFIGDAWQQIIDLVKQTSDSLAQSIHELEPESR